MSSRPYTAFNLSFEIDAYQVIFLDFEPPLDRIDEEGKLAASLGVLLRGTLHGAIPQRGG
jgi:hypothetical protein